MTEISRCLQARYYKGGLNKHLGEASGVAIPVLTPERAEKRQNGRRLKENGEPAFTLTAQDRHGVAVGVDISGNNVVGLTNVSHCLNANDQRKIFGAHQERTLGGLVLQGNTEEKKHQPMYVELPNRVKAYAVWYEKEQCYIAIRRLTPRECFRLQGWTDEYFDKAQFVNSDTQLYKQAGNGITVPVVETIGRRLNDRQSV